MHISFKSILYREPTAPRTPTELHRCFEPLDALKKEKEMIIAVVLALFVGALALIAEPAFAQDSGFCQIGTYGTDFTNAP